VFSNNALAGEATVHRDASPLAALILIALLWGCQTPIHPRSAEVAKPGGLAWNAHLPLTTLAPGHVEGQGLEGPEHPVPVALDGNSGALGDGTALTILPFWWEFAGHLGVFSPCEVGIFLGLFRMGGDARCQVLWESEGAPLSMALGGAAAFLPGFERNGAWGRVGIDLSRHMAGIAWMLNLALTRGIESHRLFVDDPPDGIGYTPPPPNQTYDGESFPYLQIAREETRVAGAFGLGLPLGKGDWTFVIGLVPYLVIDAGPIAAATCAGCSALHVTRFNEELGVSLTLGVEGSTPLMEPTDSP